MKRDKCIIWGATGQAIVLEELISTYPMDIEVFFENNQSISTPFSHIPLIYGQEGFNHWASTKEDLMNYHFMVAIGGSNGKIRMELGEMLKQHGLKPYNAIHTTAFVSYNAEISEGAQILANSSVCAKAKLGKYVIINTSGSVDHECILGDGVHIGPGAKLAGCVELGDNVFVGTNATILPRLKIGNNTIIGAGSVVTKDLPANCTVVGNPAKIIKLK